MSEPRPMKKRAWEGEARATATHRKKNTTKASSRNRSPGGRGESWTGLRRPGGRNPGHRGGPARPAGGGGGTPLGPTMAGELDLKPPRAKCNSRSVRTCAAPAEQNAHDGRHD